MNVLFSSDDNYARHMGVAMVSLLSHNTDVEKIRLFVIDNHISKSNIEKLNLIVDRFENAEISYIPFETFENQLHLDLAWPISLSSYARLFVAEVLPADVNRVLYLDCDVIINGSLSEFWNTDLDGMCLGAIQDMVPSHSKEAVGLLADQPYFNAGVLLFDLTLWRQLGIGSACLDYIASHGGRVTHHDQGVLNGILKGQWKRLPLNYNVMTIHFMMSHDKSKKIFPDASSFYTKAEIANAISRPFILHFTPSFTSHPWERNCKHPMRSLYVDVLKMTPWKDYPLEKDKNPWYVRFLNWRYRELPF